MCIVEFFSAFYTVDKDSLWWIMAVYGMLTKLLSFIKACYASSRRRSAQVGQRLRFDVAFDKDVLSPLHFSITL